MRYLLLASAALLIPATALAQTTQDGFNVPSDVPLYVESFDGYATGSTEPVLGDGSETWGGDMPVEAYQLPNVPTPTELLDDWTNATPGDGSGFKAFPPEGTATEAKFRTISAGVQPAGTYRAGQILWDDPIRNWGQPGTSHLHCFFGSTSTNAFSTYKSLRERAIEASENGMAASTIAGGPLNATGYWHPCILKEDGISEGVPGIVPVSNIVVYYKSGANGQMQRLPRGLRYVSGVNMDDPDDVAFKADIADANAAASWSGRYVYDGNGFEGYKCEGATNNWTGEGTTIISFRNPDGTDPWDGTCVDGARIALTINAPECYDGVNLWSPGGYKHLRPTIIDNLGGTPDDVCPEGWYRLPKLELVIWLETGGWDDYQHWYLASDMHMYNTLVARGETRTVLRGESAHIDWMNGWDDDVLFGSAEEQDGATADQLGWMQACAGAKGATPHECDGSTFNSALKLVGGSINEAAPDSTRIPQVGTYNGYDPDDPSTLIPIPSGSSGEHTTHVHGD